MKDYTEINVCRRSCSIIIYIVQFEHLLSFIAYAVCFSDVLYYFVCLCVCVIKFISHLVVLFLAFFIVFLFLSFCAYHHMTLLDLTTHTNTQYVVIFLVRTSDDGFVHKDRQDNNKFRSMLVEKCLLLIIMG